VPKPYLNGQRFGRLVVLERVPREMWQREKDAEWLCGCDCGKLVHVKTGHLNNGNTQSCGCFHREVVSQVRHGHTRSSTYVCWANMIQRCRNSRRLDYPNYGGRGIIVCDEWLDFENFLADMGEKPQHMSIDRIDNDGNYEPGNCRWATAGQQRANRRDA